MVVELVKDVKILKVKIKIKKPIKNPIKKLAKKLKKIEEETKLFLTYLFATHDSPYIPIRKREQPYKSKRKLINFYAWRGPMFVEDFESMPESNYIQNGCKNTKNYDNIFIGSTYSDNPMNLPSDPAVCCPEKEMKKQKYLRDFDGCNKWSLYSRRF